VCGGQVPPLVYGHTLAASHKYRDGLGGGRWRLIRSFDQGRAALPRPEPASGAGRRGAAGLPGAALWARAGWVEAWAGPHGPGQPLSESLRVRVTTSPSHYESESLRVRVSEVRAGGADGAAAPAAKGLGLLSRCGHGDMSRALSRPRSDVSDAGRTRTLLSD
jgi:hypothetical protein